MDEQNRDNFYEGPPIEEQERWHDNAVVAEGEARPGERQPLEGSLDEVDLPEGGFDPQPSLLERPHSSQSGPDQGTMTRDQPLTSGRSRGRWARPGGRRLRPDE